MAQNDPTGVIEVFELLMEKLKAEIDIQNKLGMRAFEKGDHGAARKAADRASHISSLREQVVSLCKSWVKLAISHDTEEIPHVQQENTKVGLPKTRRHDLGRLPSGICTPQSAYCQPILKALYEMGGSGRTGDVLVRLEQLMRGVLNEADYELYPHTRVQRWSKFAQWERDTMVKEGLLKSNSAYGIWEITEAGRKALNKGV
jgi:restriction system protein